MVDNEEISNDELDQLYAESFQGIQTGSVLTGRVITVKPDAVIVDVGYKSEGVIRGSEFSAEELASIKPGDEMEVYVVAVIDSEGTIILSKEKASRIKSWDVIEEAFKNGTPVDGTFREKTKGGMFVDIMGVRAFLPASHVDLRPIKDLDSLVGQKAQFKIIKLNNKRSNIIVSRRAHLEESRLKLKSGTLEGLAEGTIVKGIIKNITDYGVFVDLGGIDGLLHISDISWGRITHPSKTFTVGQEVEVKVLSFDRESERVTLGYKQKYEDPWSTVEEKYPIGTRVKGKVVSVTDYGAFIEIEDALEGLVHVTEIEWGTRPKHPSKYLSPDDEVEAVVLKADKNDRRLSLSIKQIKQSPWQLVSERYRPGQTITGKVRGITDFGAFIGLPEGVDGLVHISDMSWTRHIKHPSELLKKGQTVEAVILAIEPEKERIALGIKQLAPDPWVNDIPQRFAIGDEVDCIVLKQTEFGIFVELAGEIEGLIYSSEVVPTEVPISDGDQITARIIKIDLVNRKIGLSMKNLSGEE